MSIYTFIFLVLLSSVSVGQSLKRQAAKFLIRHEQFGDKSLTWSDVERMYYFKLLVSLPSRKQNQTLRKEPVKLYSLWSYGSHAKSFLLMAFGRRRLFLGENIYDKELPKISAFLNPMNDKDKSDIIAAFTPYLNEM